MQRVLTASPRTNQTRLPAFTTHPFPCKLLLPWGLKVEGNSRKNYSASLISICIPTFLCMSLLHLWECILWVSCKIKPVFRKYRFALRRGEGLHSPFPPCFPGKQDKLLQNLYQAPLKEKRRCGKRLPVFLSWLKTSHYVSVSKSETLI